VKKLAIAGLVPVLIAFAANADIIYFKDGLKTICQERAWEEDGRVKCEYGGWIITYQKSDVLRILRTTRPPKRAARPKEKKGIVRKTEPQQSITGKIASPNPDFEGHAFYDPRRPFKYWTDKNTKHKNYQEAIRALAKKYNRPPEWIQAHMGETNDLAAIHRNLTKPDSAAIGTTGIPSVKKKPAIEFYNPRRPFPYWTDASVKHKSFQEAIRTLAQKYNRSPQWVRRHMGETNDLSQIHHNLRTRQTAESSQ
jgi:hypothetical protein